MKLDISWKVLLLCFAILIFVMFLINPIIVYNALKDIGTVIVIIFVLLIIF